MATFDAGSQEKTFHNQRDLKTIPFITKSIVCIIHILIIFDFYDKGYAVLNQMPCSSPWMNISSTTGNFNKCVLVNKARFLNYTASQALCISLSGSLVEVHSESEHRALAKVLGMSNFVGYWLGLAQPAAGVPALAWASGDPLNFTAWGRLKGVRNFQLNKRYAVAYRNYGWSLEIDSKFLHSVCQRLLLDGRLSSSKNISAEIKAKLNEHTTSLQKLKQISTELKVLMNEQIHALSNQIIKVESATKLNNWTLNNQGTDIANILVSVQVMQTWKNQTQDSIDRIKTELHQLEGTVKLNMNLSSNVERWISAVSELQTFTALISENVTSAHERVDELTQSVRNQTTVLSNQSKAVSTKLTLTQQSIAEMKMNISCLNESLLSVQEDGQKTNNTLSDLKQIVEEALGMNEFNKNVSAALHEMRKQIEGINELYIQIMNTTKNLTNSMKKVANRLKEEKIVNFTNQIAHVNFQFVDQAYYSKVLNKNVTGLLSFLQAIENALTAPRNRYPVHMDTYVTLLNSKLETCEEYIRAQKEVKCRR